MCRGRPARLLTGAAPSRTGSGLSGWAPARGGGELGTTPPPGDRRWSGTAMCSGGAGILFTTPSPDLVRADQGAP